MALTENMRGAAFMTGAMAAFVLNDAAMKSLAPDMPLFQAILIRSVMVAALLALLIRVQNKPRVEITRKDWHLILWRGLMEVLGAVFFLTALFNAPIANVTAILQALPLTVSLAAALMLGETIGWRRLLAILIGFLGVLLIVRPGTDGFTIYSIYALLAVICVTFRDIAARKLSPDVPTTRVALITVLMIAVGAAIGSLFEPWVMPDVTMVGLLAVASSFVIGGYLFSISAMRVGEIGFVTPFRYSSLLVALVVGLLLFGEWPDVWTLIGSAIIVATGIFTLMRERRAAAPALRLR